MLLLTVICVHMGTHPTIGARILFDFYEDQILISPTVPYLLRPVLCLTTQQSILCVDLIYIFTFFISEVLSIIFKTQYIVKL